MECYEKWQTLILLYAVVFMGNEVHADHWRTYISCSYQCSDCKKTNKKNKHAKTLVWVAYCRFLCDRRWCLLSLLKCIWSSPDSCLDITEKWSCVFLFSERRYYTKDLL